MTAIQYSNKKPKQETKPSLPLCCFCIPLRVGCLVMGYMTLFYSSVISVTLLAVLTWFIVEVGGFAVIMSSEYLPGFLFAHIMSIIIFLLLLNISTIVLTILCLIGIHKRRPHLMHWHISFAAARLLVVVATLGYNLLAELNCAVLVLQLADIGVTIFYIRAFKTYMDHLYKEVASEAQSNYDQSGDIKKPIV